MEQKNIIGKSSKLYTGGKIHGIAAAVFAFLFAALPVSIFLMASQAAVSTVTFEAESGVSAPATEGKDSNASAGAFLQFATANTGTSPTQPSPGTTPQPQPVPTTPPAGGTTHLQNVQAARADYAADPRVNCSAYPNEKRLFLETQVWWMDNDSIKFPSSQPQNQLPVDGDTGGHSHTGTCFPHDQKIAGGKLKFDVRLMLHKGNRGKVMWLDVGVGPGGTSVARINFANPLTCPGAENPAINCTIWIPVEVDTAKIPAGYQELRFRINVIQQNGERMFASTGWQAWYHGGTSTFRKPTWIEARGWYENANYANARFLSAVPYEKKSGTWTFNVASVPGAGGVPITQHGVFVDAFFNKDDFGTIILEGKGPRTGSVSIDTTKLDNGLHYLAILSSQEISTGGTNTGLLNIPFIVQN